MNGHTLVDDHDRLARAQDSCLGRTLLEGGIRTGRERLVETEPGLCCLAVRVRSGASSRAEAKGEGVPTGMSATAAVAGKPKYTPTSLRQQASRCRANAVTHQPAPSEAGEN